MATDIRPAGYIPQGTFSGYIPPQAQIERRQRLADILGAQAMDVSPLQSPWQALARVAQGAVAGYGNYQAGQMEQQRYQALRQAMGGGITPEQAFATGDPQLMQYGEFAAQMAQHRLEAERQAEMLRLAQEQSAREGTRLQYDTPGAREAARIAAERDQLKTTGAEAATRFIAAARERQRQLGEFKTDPKTGKQIPGSWTPSEYGNTIFGHPFATSPAGQMITAGTGLGAQSENNRRNWDAGVEGLNSDYAIFQNPRTPNFEGAARGLPTSSSVTNPKAAYDRLEQQIQEAKHAGGIEEGGAAAEPVTTQTLPPPQHPLAPRHRAGEAQAATPQGGGLPYPGPDPAYPNLTPEVWATKNRQWQEDWIRNSGGPVP